MIEWTLMYVVIPTAVLIGLVVGVYYEFKDRQLQDQLEEWPSRRAWEARRRKNLPRDSHAQARMDGSFIDGMVTGALLDEVDDMFR